MHKEGQDGCTAAADAQGGKDQDDGVELQVSIWREKEGGRLCVASFSEDPEDDWPQWIQK